MIERSRRLLCEDEQDVAEAMEYTKAGDNHGSRAFVPPDDYSGDAWGAKKSSLATEEYESPLGVPIRDQLIPIGEETYHGMIAHRGLLTEGEFENLDILAVKERACELLGTDSRELYEIYQKSGPPSPARILRRAELDEKLLQLRDSEVSMRLVAIALGWTVTADSCPKMKKVLSRARKARDDVG